LQDLVNRKDFMTSIIANHNTKCYIQAVEDGILEPQTGFLAAREHENLALVDQRTKRSRLLENEVVGLVDQVDCLTGGSFGQRASVADLVSQVRYRKVRRKVGRVTVGKQLGGGEDDNFVHTCHICYGDSRASDHTRLACSSRDQEKRVLLRVNSENLGDKRRKCTLEGAGAVDRDVLEELDLLHEVPDS
jgi:hypothetical protein